MAEDDVGFSYQPPVQNYRGQEPRRPANRLPKPISALGLAGFILGTLACAVCWIPGFGLSALPLCAIGLLLSGLGFLVSIVGKRSSASFAFAGVVICATAAFISLGLTTVILKMVEKRLAVSSSHSNRSIQANQTSTSSRPSLGFAAYHKLNCFVGVECLYTDKFGTGLPVVGDSRRVQLVPMSKVVVKKVINDAFFSKLYIMTQGAKAIDSTGFLNDKQVSIPNTLLVLTAQISYTDREILRLDLCPTADLENAKRLWLGKQLRYKGTKIGEVEVESGTAVKVTQIVPTGMSEGLGQGFDLTFDLPSGASAKDTIYTTYGPEKLQPF